jgi:hypothetical protein
VDHRSDNRPEARRAPSFGWIALFILPLTAAGMLAACAAPPPPVRSPKLQCDARPKFRDSDFAAHETDFFDRLVTREATLADPIRQAASYALAPLSKNGQRHYTFILARQPAMDPARHFDVITVSIARAGTLAQTSGEAPRTSGVGGPNGMFSDATVRTSDGAYDLRISEGTLLPEAVALAPFDVRQAVLDLAHRYDKALNARQTSTCGAPDHTHAGWLR